MATHKRVTFVFGDVNVKNTPLGSAIFGFFLSAIVMVLSHLQKHGNNYVKPIKR